MEMRDIDKVIIPDWVWGQQKHFVDNRAVYGFDTETIDGFARLLTASDGDYIFGESFKDFADFITQKKYRSQLNFFYNLNYDCNAIVKYLPSDELKQFGMTGKVTNEETGINLRYIPKKFFQMEKNRNVISFYDIAQFYHMSLKQASKYVGLEKGEYAVGEMTEEKLNDPDLLKYGLQDAYITGKLGESFRDMVSKITSVKHYYSSASIGKRFLLTSGIKFNFPSNKKLLDMALKSYQGGRFEVMQRGYFDDIYSYDINSAYPEQIVGLEECTGKVWSNLEYEPEANHSFFKCDISIYNVMMSPMKWQQKGGLMVYPVGDFEDVYLTKKEYELIDELGFPIKIKDAIHMATAEAEKPFGFFKDLYAKRKKLKEAGDNQQMVYKYIMNSVYGCFIQHTKEHSEVLYPTKNFEMVNGHAFFYDTKYRAGSLFNPIWASEVTANTRVKLFRDFQTRANYVISLATDGVMLTKPINLDVGEELGQYDYERDKGIVLGSGVYHTEKKTRFRGFGRKMDLFQILRDNAEKTIIPFERTRPKGLKECLISKKLGQESINQFITETRFLNLNFDKKRIWERPFDSARDCLENHIESVPLKT